MKKHRKLSILLVLIMVASLFAACGQDVKPEETPAKAPESASESASAASAAPEKEVLTLSKEYKGTTLSFLCTSHSWTNIIADFLPEFEEATGINVEMQYFVDSQLSSKLAVSSAGGGSDLDVFGIRPQQEIRLFVKNGWVDPLDAYIEKSAGYDFVDFFDAGRELVSQNGKVYSIPYLSEREILYYNTGLFEKAGFTSPPKTFEELEEYCKKLHDPNNGIYGIALRGNGENAVTQFSGFLRSFGGDFFVDKKATLNTPEAIAAFEFYGKLCRGYSAPDVMNITWSDSLALFTQGRAAMRIDCDSQYGSCIDPETSLIADKVGYAVFPEGPKGAKPFNIIGWSLSIGSGSKNKDAAWEFIKWSTSKDVDVRIAQSGHFGARYSTWKDPAVTKAVPKALIDVINVTNPIGVPTDRPFMINGGEARTLVGNVISAAIEGKDVKAEADKANTALQALLDRE